MSASRRFHLLRLWAVLTVLGGVVGWVYTAAMGGMVEIGTIIGISIAGSIVAFELFLVQGPRGVRLRRLPLSLFLLLTTVVWAVAIAVCLNVVNWLYMDQFIGHGYPVAAYIRDFGFSLGVSFVFNFVIRIRSLVGTRVLGNFLLGRYHRPLQESRVFMFLDVADSTRLAEELGDIRVQSLIGEFFFDIASPIADHGGETHRYIGDEVVVTWPLEEGKEPKCIECVYAIKARVRERAAHYQRTYGVVPRYRVGLHGGEVVASEIGDSKREIVYFGRTINTAARLCAYAKEAGQDILISEDLLQRLKLPSEVRADRLGAVALKGKPEPVEVYAVE